MNYRRSSPYPTPHHGRLIVPELLVMHTTEGGSTTWLDTAFRGDDPTYAYSVHWCIYADGAVVEYAPWRPGEAVACYHAGVSEWRGRASCNYWSLGFEIQHSAGETYPEAQVRAIINLMRLVKSEYPDIEPVTHRQIAMPRGRKPDPTSPWGTDVWPRVKAAWEEDDMFGDEDRKDLQELRHTTAVKQSFVAAINNALAIEWWDEARRLNDVFYERWPRTALVDGKETLVNSSGLPVGWQPPK